MPEEEENDRFQSGLRQFCFNSCKVGVKCLLEEFLTLKMETQAIGDKSKAAFDGHSDKNRYKSVYCIDSTRVKLTFPEGADDYIHANWVNDVEGRIRYICTQGPMENTVDDFWRMAWQEKAKSIVMLCNIKEGGWKKCAKYWPSLEEPLILACKLKVKATKTERLETNLLLTEIEMIDEKGIAFNLKHFHWMNWPDRGVPETSLSVFQLLNRLDKSSPIVVHCSAGIGRTGTIVALDIAYQMLQKGQVPIIHDIVRGVRNARHGSVQSDVQYIYVHRLLMALAENEKVVSRAAIATFVSEYEAMCKTDVQFRG